MKGMNSHGGRAEYTTIEEIRGTCCTNQHCSEDMLMLRIHWYNIDHFGSHSLREGKTRKLVPGY